MDTGRRMAAGGVVRVICVVVVELLLDDIFVVFLLLLFLLAVTRSGAIRHGLLVMGGVGCILLTWRRMGRGHERGMEGVRERLIILGIVHDFLEDYMIKAQRWSNALRAEGTIDVGNNNQTPWERTPDAFAFPHAVPLRPCILRGKSQKMRPGIARRLRGPGYRYRQPAARTRPRQNPAVPAYPKFVPMAKTRGNTAAGIQGPSESHFRSRIRDRAIFQTA